ncbi:formin-binding protein [Aspergillus fumigatus]
MPGTVAEPPSVSLSFANNFWGKDDAGVGPMLDRMHGAKVTCDELKTFYNIRAAIEDEYSRKLMALCRKPLGTHETGSLRSSFDVVRGETESIAKSHAAIATQMKRELEEPLIAFAGGSKERRKIIQTGIERLLKTKIQQTQTVNKKFQDLEEERIDFTKSSLWAYANIASTVCVSDDASCEKIRLALENCEVEKDIVSFIKERGTGQDIPDPPKFINFARGDVNDTSSELSEEDGFSVAQFQRTINPAFRSSSPQPSTYESHHEPRGESAARPDNNSPTTPASRDATVTPQKPTQPPAPLDLRRGGHLPPNYDPNQHGEIAPVPHNAYPTDGMTMFCRTGPPSERSSGSNSAYRPSSRESQSEISNPTSVSSQEPPSARQSPTKPTNGVALPGLGGDKQIQKRRSAFFSNSPFRRKSRHDKDRNSGPSHTPTRSTWESPTKQATPVKAPQPQPPQPPAPVLDNERQVESPEPADPRANFQLNVGNNVFDVASPDKATAKKAAQTAKAGEEELDPIARALADLKGGGKQSMTRVSADRYHGIATPVPSAPPSNYSDAPVATPPPAYNDPSVKRLDAPQPAFTSAQMQKTTQKYTGQTKSMLRGSGNTPSLASRNSAEVPRAKQEIPRPKQETPRAKSPIPRRSASPQVPSPQVISPQPISPQVSPARVETRTGHYSRGASPSPSTYQANSVRSRYSQSPSVSTPPQRPVDAAPSPREFPRRSSPNPAAARAVSPQPQFRQQTRPSSAGGMELQLSSGGSGDMYGTSYDSYSARGRDSGRPMSYYGDGGSQGGRSRSRTVAVADPSRQFSRDGRPILHFARALYSYTAAIPEELGFSKGDVLSVIRLQDDGWWEAEITTTRSRTGLVPSNYLQII